MTEDIRLFILIASILLVPKILLRFRLPSGITAILLGLAAGVGLDWYDNSQTLYILGTLGITSLFLFAGMEVEVSSKKYFTKFGFIGRLCFYNRNLFRLRAKSLFDFSFGFNYT